MTSAFVLVVAGLLTVGALRFYRGEQPIAGNDERSGSIKIMRQRQPEQFALRAPGAQIERLVALYPRVVQGVQVVGDPDGVSVALEHDEESASVRR